MQRAQHLVQKAFLNYPFKRQCIRAIMIVYSAKFSCIVE